MPAVLQAVHRSASLPLTPRRQPPPPAPSRATVYVSLSFLPYPFAWIICYFTWRATHWVPPASRAANDAFFKQWVNRGIERISARRNSNRSCCSRGDGCLQQGTHTDRIGRRHAAVTVTYFSVN